MTTPPALFIMKLFLQAYLDRVYTRMDVSHNTVNNQARTWKLDYIHIPGAACKSVWKPRKK